MLVGRRAVVEAKVFLEAHAAGNEVQQRRAHAQRRDGGGGNALRSTAREDFFADVEGEEVEAVEIDIGIVEKRVDVAARQAFVKDADLELGVDVSGHRDHHLDLRAIERVDGRPRLAIEVGQSEAVEVGNRERSDAQPREREQIDAADAAQAGDADPRILQPLLLGFGHPAEIAREGGVV